MIWGKWGLGFLTCPIGVCVELGLDQDAAHQRGKVPRHLQYYNQRSESCPKCEQTTLTLTNANIEAGQGLGKDGTREVDANLEPPWRFTLT